MSFTIKNLFVCGVIALVLSGCGSKQEAIYAPHKPTYGKAKSSAAVHRATMRPYSINGVTYYPTVVEVGEKFRGVASWYGNDFHGKRTSNGEIYDMHDFTAAHKTLPMNTMVKVKNLKNGKSVVVRVNDRGPFVAGRIIDLSYAAAKKIGIVGSGTAPVELEILGFDNKIESLTKKRSVVLSNYAVQIGSFRKIEGARITKRNNALVDGRYRAVIKRFDYEGEPLYRVWLTGFQSENEARDFIRRGDFPGAFIIRNSDD